MTIINHSRYTKVVSSVKTGGSSINVSTVIPRDSWSGKRCIILGGGPSLIGFDFNKLSGELTIGINKSFASFPVLVNYSMDPQFYDMVSFPNNDPVNQFTYIKWKSFSGIKVFLNRHSDSKFSGVYTVNSVGTKSISVDPAIGIFPGRNSGFGAIMLAIAFGCKKIGLLGYDMAVDMVRERTHYHEGYRHLKRKLIKEVLLSNQRKLNKFKEEFEEFAPLISNFGVEVVNLNPNSGLNCFQKVPFKEFLSNE